MKYLARVFILLDFFSPPNLTNLSLPSLPTSGVHPPPPSLFFFTCYCLLDTFLDFLLG